MDGTRRVDGTRREATAREAVGNFQDERSLEAAVDELQGAGFDRYDISVVAGRRSFEFKFGAMYSNVAELENDLETPTAVFVGRGERTQAKAAIVCGLAYVGAVGVYEVISSGGTSATAYWAAGLAGGIGGIIGCWISKLIEQHHTEYVGQHLVRGGLLLLIRTTDFAREAKACQIMTCHAALDVHIRDGVTASWVSLSKFPVRNRVT